MAAPVTRIDNLTAEQRARMPEWRDEWIDIGLRTGPADRPVFERNVARCYVAAGLEPPKRVVWVSSPLMLAFCGPAAALAIELRKRVATNPKFALALLRWLPVGSAVDSEVRSEVRSAVDSAVGSAVGSAVRSAVGSAVRSAVGSAVRSAVGSAVGSAVDSAVGSAVGNAVRSAVGSEVESAVRSAVGSAVGSEVESEVESAVRSAVGSEVESAVESAVGSVIRSAILSIVRQRWAYYLGGQFWVGGWYWGSPSFVSFFREVCGLDLGEEMSARALAYVGTAESACWWWPHKDFVMVCERPVQIRRDAQGRLHSATGKAIEWPDGWGFYRIHGVTVPEDLVTHPEQLTVSRISGERNAEVKRTMLEIFGLARYVAESKAEVLHENEDAAGRRRRLLRHDGMMFVEVHNSTPEPDGYRKTYLLAVHPELRPIRKGRELGQPQALTCQNAVASTFGLRGSEYRPEAET